MKKGLLLLLTSIIFLGCGSGLKSGWGNFTAYYNTYYNAKKSYNAGVQKVLDSKVNYNPQQPIRIHETPINAGAQDFDKAIEKGAEILRKYEDSKWVDNSLHLIGKSYYFKEEYFSADQKFQEIALTTSDEELIQESILWRSRVLLEMELYGQGIQYINEQLLEREGIWKTNKKAELKIILAQYYVEQENLEDAIDQLSESLPSLSKKKYKERGYFLLGQLYERKGNYRDAYNAYRNVENFYVDYDLQYLALRKRAETARLLGDNESALSTFNKMVRDDKNTEFKTELDYEIAKTYQKQGEFEEAVYVYKRLLNNKVDRPSTETKALTFYELAEIYRYGYNDFELAAAYYDTSSRQNASAQKLPENYNAKELALSFGEYARLKNELHYRDSLLWVSNLSQPQLDSLVAEIKKRKLKEIEEERKSLREQNNTLINVSSNSETATNTERNGFLNVNSPNLQANARNQFIAVWGDRPLVDNWRVRELMTSSDSGIENANEGEQVNQQSRTFANIQTSVDLSEVPFQESKKIEAKNEIAKLKYELGNLFFISLEMPDSAKVYFIDVIQNYPESKEIPISYYSLIEIQSLQGNEEEAIKNAEKLVMEFPNSRYADRVAEKYGIEKVVGSDSSDMELTEQYREFKADTLLTREELAEKSTKLALENTNNIESASILFDATQIYINLAKEREIYVENYTNWISQKQSWDQEKKDFKMLQDSAKISLKDDSLSESKRIEFIQLADSTLDEPDFSDTFPYRGEYWDKARINLDLFISNFRNSKLLPRVRVLKNELQKPVENEPEGQGNPEIENEPVSSGVNLFCSELEPTPLIRGGLEDFLSKIEYSTSENDQVIYLLNVNQRGVVEEYNMVSEEVDESIERSFNSAIENDLTFEPLIIDGEAIQFQCKFRFPLK